MFHRERLTALLRHEACPPALGTASPSEQASAFEDPFEGYAPPLEGGTVRGTRWNSFLIQEERTSAADNHSRREGTTVYSAWRTLHDLKEGACPECQGSAYVPSTTSKERMVDECRECNGTGTSAAKKAA